LRDGLTAMVLMIGGKSIDGWRIIPQAQGDTLSTD
jgi:hypothetical protein